METSPRRKLRVDLSELEFAIDQHDPEITYYLDLETGRIVPLSDTTRYELESMLEEYDGEEPDLPSLIAELEVQDWEKDALLEGYRIEMGERERYLQVPASDSRQGFEDMQDFAETVRDRALRPRLETALRGRGPFRAFKNTLSGFPKDRERWFAFQNERIRRRALDWLESQGIEPVLD
jgi:hypothetical protein